MSWLDEASRKLSLMPKKALDIRERAKNDLVFYARLVNPGYMYGAIHEDIYRWLQNYSLFGAEGCQSSNKLIMLPRGHLKSHIVATWSSWIILRHPEISMLYLSATAELAIVQLYAIQNILCSTTFTRYFPEYVHPQEGKREKWSSTAIIVDHPKRSEEGSRDATVKIAGLTTNTTGWHADIILSDDIVVPENAYTDDGRDSVAKKTSQFTSIRNTGGFTLACGTRYHPSDIYDTWKNQVFDVFDDEGIKTGQEPVWEVVEHAVEEDNIFLWPRSVRSDGKAYGFDLQSLARIRAEYIDKVQYYAQYYNDPNDASTDRINRECFQYINPRLLVRSGNRWEYNGRRLNIYAAVDFAFSLEKAADFTAIVVIGMDSDKNVYVLDIDRFKSDKTSEYFRHIRDLHSKWRFNKLSAEVSVAQKVIVNEIKSYLKKDGMVLPIEDCRPTQKKEERIAAALEHRYDNLTIWHCEGGWTPVLEEELVMARPPHDDLKDALASAVTIAVPPARSGNKSNIIDLMTKTNKSRFGGY
jgi:predicted phage terminase large subunit-like protein